MMPCKCFGLLRVLPAAVAVCLVAGCGEAEPGAVDASFIHIPGEGETPLGPVAFWSADSVDLGILAAGAKQRIEYPVKNTGDAPLIITQVRPSCGCTAVQDWNRGALAPGESRTIVLEFNTEDRIGAVSESATVVTNAFPSAYTLHFAARVVGPDSPIEH